MIKATIAPMTRCRPAAKDEVEITFPITRGEMLNALAAIGVDDDIGEEIVFRSVKVPGRTWIEDEGEDNKLVKFYNPNELNYLASILEGMSEIDMKKFKILAEDISKFKPLTDLINLTAMLTNYSLYEEIKDRDEFILYYETRKPDDYEEIFKKVCKSDVKIIYEDLNANISNEYGSIIPKKEFPDDIYDGKNIPDEYIILKSYNI